MAINHGIKVREADTAITAPVTGSNSVQVVIGTAPVNMASDPAAAVNTPILAYSANEAKMALGYSSDFKKYTLCAVMYAMTNLYSVAPVIFINVLDPKNAVAIETKSLTVSEKQATIEEEGVLPSTLVVSAGEDNLVKDTDYTVTFDKNGYAVITLIKEAAALTVSGKKLNPDGVTEDDIIGSVDVNTGKETGMEVIRQVYPKLGIVPGILEAPYFSKQPKVAIALTAKAIVNGCFEAQVFVDIDSSAEGATKYTDVKTVKEKSGANSTYNQDYWPCARIDDIILPMSVAAAVRTQYLDNVNGDVPYNSPSNKPLAITGICLEDGTEVILDQDQANTVNSFGVVTAINVNGFRLWGNYTAAFPADNDAKNIWINVRRMFNWQSNNFILNYTANVDDPMNRRLIDTVIDSENIRCSSYAPEYWAGAKIEYLSSDNNESTILGGHLIFRQHIAPYTPAQFIENIMDYDVATLKAALTGGN